MDIVLDNPTFLIERIYIYCVKPAGGDGRSREEPEPRRPELPKNGTNRVEGAFGRIRDLQRRRNQPNP